jgi:predicted porin
VVDYLAQATASGNWPGYLFAHPYDNDNTDNSFRLGNSVKYASPEIGHHRRDHRQRRELHRRGGGINYTFGAATAGFAYTNSNYKDPAGNCHTGACRYFPPCSSWVLNGPHAPLA